MIPNVMNFPLVSIVVPNYNNEDYIVPFIDSIIQQTYTNWELIIVDDGSTNNSCDLIRGYVQKDERIRLYHRVREPKGASTCRNIGLSYVRGKYICFFDSDDLVPEYCIEVRVKEMNMQADDVGFLVFPIISFQKQPYDEYRLVLGLPFFKDDLKMFLKRYRLPFAVWTNIYRREVFYKYSLQWDECLKSLQDSDFNINALCKSIKYEYSQDRRPNYFWRIGGNPSSITKTIKSIANIDSQLCFYDKLLNLFGNSCYEVYVRRFGKTLLFRCLSCEYPEIPPVLINWKYEYIRIKIIGGIYRILHLRNEWIKLLIFGVFFPICCIDEFLFRIKNYNDMNRYFKKVRNSI